MALTQAERIEIVLTSGERSTRVIAEDFNQHHPNKPPITHSAVVKLLAKFRETGSVADKLKAGRSKTATDEATYLKTGLFRLTFSTMVPHLITGEMSGSAWVSSFPRR